MSASNSAEANILLLLFNNTNWANVGDATGLRGSTVAGSWYVSLHTADPGEAGTQATSETAYTNYVRVAVARSAGGWTCSGTAPAKAENTAAVTFATCGVTGATLTHFGIGVASAGATELDFSGTVTPNLGLTTNFAPYFAALDLDVTVD